MEGTQMITAKAIGPERDGCHDIPEVNPDRFHALGGEDIVVWGSDYTIEARTMTAIEYVVNTLRLEMVEFS